jgi:hypothetical protein
MSDRVIQRACIRRRIYVAGPMAVGNFVANVRMGIDAGNELRDLGFVPFIPHLDSLWTLVHPRDYEDLLDLDFAWIEVCDGLLRIPGESKGADREVAHAHGLGIPVFYDVAQLVAHFARSGAL